MNKALPLAAGLFLTGLGCKSPQLATIKKTNTPIQVAMSLPATVPDRARVEQLYKDALSQQLGSQMRLAVAGSEDMAKGPVLCVTVSYVDATAQETGSAAVQGDALGTAYSAGQGKPVGTALGNGLATGTVFGLITYAGASIREKGLEHRLGYTPRHAVCKVEWVEAAGSPPKLLTTTNAWEVTKAMRPMPAGETATAESIMQEEARALGQVLSAKFK